MKTVITLWDHEGEIRRRVKLDGEADTMTIAQAAIELIEYSMSMDVGHSITVEEVED